MKYIAKATEVRKSDNPGHWSYNKITIYEVDEVDGSEREVGSYERNYHGMGEATFHPFKQKGKWYALYSKDYTATRVMSLPDCKDICGESGNAYGFCPVEYYVPTKEDLSHWDPIRIHSGKRRSEDDEYWRDNEKALKAHEKEGSDFNAVEESKKRRQHQREEEEVYMNLDNLVVGQFGFIAGCVWGDDSSWKLQYLDLSKITEGKLERTDRWGYLELPDKPLKQCLNFEHFQANGGEDVQVLTTKTVPVMDREYWGHPKVGDIYTFREDSLFNGAKVKVTDTGLESCRCEIVESKNPVKVEDLWIEYYQFDRYAKKDKYTETKWQTFWRRLKYLLKGAI